MKEASALFQTIQRIDGRGYKAYKDLEGSYRFDRFVLHIDYVQGDPFATASKLRISLAHDFPEWSYRNRSREVALRDFLARQFGRQIRSVSRNEKSGAKGGTISIDKPGQEILERTAVVLYEQEVEVRFRLSLPAFGRKIAGKQALAIFQQDIPALVEKSLFFAALDKEKLQEHVEVNEDADALREQLGEKKLVAFVAEGALLPRASGIDPRPLQGGFPFQSPDSLRVEFHLPNRSIRGMGIPEGISLIVGGGYHGKSTLLQALEVGVYNHIPGDGREFVICEPGAAKIRAEDGRSVEQVNISPFIGTLPHGKDTRHFSTENASGSTSQAANVMEALEAGARVLLIDEDTSATNFMIRDHLMQQLVAREREPITPFIDKAQQLFTEKGVSTIVVIGGSGLFFAIADLVICMVDYQPQDLTAEAKVIAAAASRERVSEGGREFGEITARYADVSSIDPIKGGKTKVKAYGARELQFGEDVIDLTVVEQLLNPSQLRAIGDAILYMKKYLEQGMSIRAACEKVMEDIHTHSLDILSRRKNGEYALFRKQELTAALNRLRSLKALQ